MELRLNLNLPQAPREPNPELNRALMPVYNALRLVQEGFQLTESGVTSNEDLLQQLTDSVSGILAADYVTPEDLLALQQIHFSFFAPSSVDGKDNDMWLHTSVTGLTKLYAKLSGIWVLLGVLTSNTVDTTAYLAWKGSWVTTTNYLKNSVVTTSEGAVYVALVTHIASALNAPPNVSVWKLLQEAVVSSGSGIGEAVLSSRAPAVDPAPPNFIISRLNDLVYARVA